MKTKSIPKVTLIRDYFDFICKIPQIKSFVLKHGSNNFNYVTVSFTIPFDCFKKINKSIFVDIEREPIISAVEGKIVGEKCDMKIEHLKMMDDFHAADFEAEEEANDDVSAVEVAANNNAE
jgi:hypothetical protein